MLNFFAFKRTEKEYSLQYLTLKEKKNKLRQFHQSPTSTLKTIPRKQENTKLICRTK